MMDINAIQAKLPHEYPFLMIDRVTELEKGNFIKGYKNVTINEHFFAGHFPGRPIMPGVMIVEVLAQLSGILAMQSIEGAENNVFFLTSIENAKFKKIVIPGDQLLLTSTVDRKKSKLWKFKCQAQVENYLACSVNLTIAKE